MKIYIKRASDYAHIGTVVGHTIEEVKAEIRKAGRTSSVKESNASYTILLVF